MKNRLGSLLRSYKNGITNLPGRQIPSDVHKAVYNFSLEPSNSVDSTDSRSDRNVIRVSKLSYLLIYKHFEGINDNNITEKETTFSKTGNKKTYMVANCKMYTKSVREMHKEFCKETALNCSLSNFWKYRPFYLFPPTERSKESCLCKICQNAHNLLAAINTFQRSQNLPSHKSVSNFLSIDLLKTGFQVNETFEANSNLYPEWFC